MLCRASGHRNRDRGFCHARGKPRTLDDGWHLARRIGRPHRVAPRVRAWVGSRRSTPMHWTAWATSRSTQDAAQALAFDGTDAALAFRQTTSTVRPMRDDDRSNRPLMGFTAEVRWALRGSNPRPSPCKGETNLQVRGILPRDRTSRGRLSVVEYRCLVVPMLYKPLRNGSTPSAFGRCFEPAENGGGVSD